MEFSYRDGDAPSPICCTGFQGLKSDKGQGTIEYVLVLVVAVAIIMGGLYQLNTAFKSWANNYFGDYLACLLETGDLPTIGGSPGDSGVCNELFKKFSLADGRPAKTGGSAAKEKDGGGDGGARRETKRAGGGGGGGRTSYGGGGRFGAGSRTVPGSQAKQMRKSIGSSTGNTGASDYGGGYNYYQRPQRHKLKDKLDNKFAFEDGRDRTPRRKTASSASKKDDNEGQRPAIKMKKNTFKSGSTDTADSGFSIGNFIKWIIIACIILALIFFLGGQALSISKSME